MKKTVVLLIVLLFLLAGCGPDGSSDSAIEQAVREAQLVRLPQAARNNARKEYYTYYLIKGIGAQEKDPTANVFTIQGHQAVLNLNVGGIIADAYYSDSAQAASYSFGKETFSYRGAFTNTSGTIEEFHISVSTVNDEFSYLLIQTDSFLFAAQCPPRDLAQMVYEMIKILRTATVDTDKVIADYSHVSTAQVKSSLISLFKEALPESGKVVDYLEDWQNDPDFIIIDQNGGQSGQPEESQP